MEANTNAVFCMRGRLPSLVGPGISARIIAFPAEPCPRIATNKTTIPNPPRKCVHERQNKMQLGTSAVDSTSVNTVAPVVLKPDCDSNIASINVMG